MHTKFPASLTRKRAAARTVPHVAPLASTAPPGASTAPPADLTMPPDARVVPPAAATSRRAALGIACGRAAIFTVVLGWAALLAVVSLRQTGFDDAPWSVPDRALSLAGLTLCAIALLGYLAARRGALARLSEHVRVPRR